VVVTICQFITYQKSKLTCPNALFEIIEFYQKLMGYSVILTPILKNGAQKYTLFVPEKKPATQILEFMNRFPPVEKSKAPKAKVIKKDDDEHDANIAISLHRLSNHPHPPPDGFRGHSQGDKKCHLSNRNSLKNTCS